MCDESRTMDLIPFGGVDRARVIGTADSAHLGKRRAPCHWSPFDHFEITDVESARSARTGSVNWTHGNALDLDGDGGDLLVSFRNLNEIAKIDAAIRRGEMAARRAPEPVQRSSTRRRPRSPNSTAFESMGQVRS